jgi:hypothetical protein
MASRFGGVSTVSTVLGSIMTLAAVACGGGGDDSAQGGGQAVSAAATHTVFQCSLANGDTQAGDDFKLTLGDGSATVESSDVGKHTGKVQKNPKDVPSTSDRYLVSGLADDGVTSIIIPKAIKTDSRATVHVEITAEKGKKQVDDFLCHPDDASGPPSSGRGGSGAKSGVKTKLQLSCKLAANSDQSFGDEMDITLTPDDNLHVKSAGPDGVDGTGAFDPAFKPKQNTGFVRYLVGGLADESSTDVLVEKPILTGKGGRIKVEASDETFLSTTFNCTPK